MENAIPAQRNWKQLCQALRKFHAAHANQHKDRTNGFKNYALKLQRYFSAVNNLLISSHCIVRLFLTSHPDIYEFATHGIAREDLDLKKYKKCICIRN